MIEVETENRDMPAMKNDVRTVMRDLRRWMVGLGVAACAIDLAAKATVLTIVLRARGH